MTKAHLIAALYIANLDQARTLATKNTIQGLMDLGFFPIALIISAIVIVIDLIRIARVTRKIGLP